MNIKYIPVLIKSHPKPTIEEIDIIMNKVRQVLFNDQESYIKY